MAPPKIDSDAARRFAEARRRAEEARQRAEAEARRKAELARQAAQAAQARAQQQVRQLKKDEVSTGKGTALKVKALGLTGANQLAEQLKLDKPTIAAKDLIRSNGQGASTLLTEDANDGKVNCLDRAVDYAKTLTPEQQKKAELVVLDDTRPGAEGTTGHVVVREDGGRVTDPSSGKKYESTEAYLKANPQYREAGTVKATDAARIFETKAGSPERAKALDDAKVPQSLRTMLVNDATPGYDRAQAEKDAAAIFDSVEGVGTKEDKLWKTLEPRTKEDIDLIRQVYKEKYGKDLDSHVLDDFSKTWNPDECNRTKLALSGLKGDDIGRSKAETDFRENAQAVNHFQNLKEHENDPAYVARYVELMKQKGHLDPFVSSNTKGLGVLNGTDAQVEVMEKSLKIAAERGVITEAEINQRAVGGPNQEVWKKVQSEAGQSRIDRARETQGGVEGVKNAAQAFNDADSKAKNLDKKLAEQLNGLDKGLTEKQRAAYIKAFQEDPENKKVYAEREAKAQALAESLEKNKAALHNGAVTSQADAAELKKALTGLAGTSQAPAALGFLKDAPKTTLDALGGKAFLDEAYGAASAKVMTAMLAKYDNPDDAFKAFADFTNELKPAFDTYGGWGQVQEGLEGLKAWKDTGKFDRLRQLTDGWKGANPFVKGIAAAGLVIGAAQAVEKGRNGEYEAMVKEIAGAGRGGLEILAATTNAMGEAGKLARFGADAADAAKFAKFAAKLAPGLGLVASSLSLKLRLDDIKNDPDAGKYISAVGDAIGVLGAAAELVPGVGTAAGLIVSGLGAGIAAVGEFVSNTINRGENEAARKKYLEQIGIDDPVRTAMATQTDQFKALTGNAGMSPEQLQTLGGTFPELFVDNATRANDLESLTEMMKSKGVTGDKALAFFEKLAGQDRKQVIAALHDLASGSIVVDSAGGSVAYDQGLDRMKKEHPAGARLLEDAGLPFP